MQPVLSNLKFNISHKTWSKSWILFWLSKWCPKTVFYRNQPEKRKTRLEKRMELNWNNLVSPWKFDTQLDVDTLKRKQKRITTCIDIVCWLLSLVKRVDIPKKFSLNYCWINTPFLSWFLWQSQQREKFWGLPVKVVAIVMLMYQIFL